MADDKAKAKRGDKEKDAAQTPEGGRSSLTRTLMVAAGVVMVALIAGIVVLRLVLMPMLATPPTEANAAAQAEGTAAGDKIPPTATIVPFEDSFSNVIMPDPNLPASLLLYRVSYLCSDPEVADLVTRNKSMFEDILADLHSYRTREELNDPMAKQSIQRQALDQSNELLQRLLPEPDPNKRILKVMHSRFAVHE